MSSLLQDVSSAVVGPLGQLRNALAQIERLGGAAGLAGDPAALRRAAAAWRQQAAAVRQLESNVAGQVQRTLSESWQGEASQAFGGNWRSLSGKLHDLAAGFDRMAAGLEQATGRSGGLNSVAAELVAEIETLLAALQGLQDLAAVTGLAGRAGAVLT
nr:WXG100 family type VII secretion target [Candidatus Dormibacteraeota bacterium]